MSFESVLNAARDGDPDAQVAMGYMFFKGEGVAQDRREAARWFGLASDAGNAEAMCNLAYIKAHGMGVRCDIQGAMELYERSAELGYPQAMFNLGFMYSDAAEVEQDWEKARHWYGRAAEAGSLVALHRLGVILEEGRGCDPDREAAMDCYTRAFDAGYPRSGVRLAGMLVSEGKVDKASKMLVRAADMGSEDAMCELGRMSLSGEGMVRSEANARRWLRKAATRGSAEAAALLEELDR